MDTGAAGSTASVSSMGGGGNAINISSSEDLGGGLRGGTNFEIRYNAATGDRASGSAGGGLFHNANVFVGGAFGTVRLGKISEASNCGFDAWGCGGGAGMMGGHSTTAGHASNGVSALVGAAAVANSVSYTTPNLNGFSASYQTSISAHTRVNERSALALNYAKGPLSAQVLRVQNTGNTAATDGSAANILDGNGEQTSIAASYDFGVARLNVFNAKTDRVTAFTGTAASTFAPNNLDRDITGFTASMPMGAVTLLAGYAKDKKAAANLDTKIAVGANYALSKRTTLGADVFKSEAAAVTGATGNAGTGFALRARHTF